MLTEWQVYRMFDSRRGAWATFQFLVRKRLVEEGADVALATARSRRLGRGRDRREPAEAELALVRRADGRQRLVLDELRRRGTARRARSCRRGARCSVPSASSRLRSFSAQ